jgi:outer membrane protein OmpA-like peptidoglycan-associated protein
MRYKITAKGRRAVTVAVSSVFLLLAIVFGASALAGMPAATTPPGNSPADPVGSGDPGGAPASDPGAASSTPTPAQTEPTPTPDGGPTPAPTDPGSAPDPTPIPVQTPPPRPFEPLPEPSVNGTRRLLVFPEGESELLAEHSDGISAFLDAVEEEFGGLDGRTILCEGNAYGEDKDLALSRARSVRDAIVAQGVPSEQVLVLTTGKVPQEGQDAELFRRVELYTIVRSVSK